MDGWWKGKKKKKSAILRYKLIGETLILQFGDYRRLYRNCQTFADIFVQIDCDVECKAFSSPSIQNFIANSLYRRVRYAQQAKKSSWKLSRKPKRQFRGKIWLMPKSMMKSTRSGLTLLDQNWLFSHVISISFAFVILFNKKRHILKAYIWFGLLIVISWSYKASSMNGTETS